MPAYICQTYGVQAAPGATPPAHCPICEDERQFVGWGGQQWTTLEALQREGRRNTLQQEEPDLISIRTQPAFAIGQRALLVRTPAGNVLWDCLSFFDAATLAALRTLGGLQAIALSHPHFYGSVADWSRAFDDCPIYVHAADAQWLQRRSPALTLWAGAVGAGVLLGSDTIMVSQDRRSVSFMYSYPNLIPLPDAAIERIVATLRPYRFARLYSAWEGRVVNEDAAGAVVRSAARYLRMRRGDEG